MASLLDAAFAPLIRTVIADPTAGSGLKWVGRAFRAISSSVRCRADASGGCPRPKA